MANKETLVPPNATFDLTLDLFMDENYRDIPFEQKKEIAFTKQLQDNIQIEDDVSEILSLILEKYELKNGVFHLKDPRDEHGHRLRKKEIITKAFPLLGGGKLILKFQTYFCEKCKDNIRIVLPELFGKDDIYPSYIKNESIGMYLEHLSSYDKVADEIYNRYKINLSKRTIRLWILEAVCSVESIDINPGDFSGYFSYDELYVKVFEGSVGIKGSKLTRVQKYALLLRDNVTKKPIVFVGDNLEGGTIFTFLYEMIKLLILHGILVKGICTDGLDEYHTYIKEINRRLIAEGLITKEQAIIHTYDIFHFKKNLYESANLFHFGKKYSKEKLPDYILNQIEEFDKVLDASSLEEAEKNLYILSSQKNTFINTLQHHIERLMKYEKEYITQIVIKELRTSNSAENYFHIIKAKKIKREYKTKKGLNGVLQLQTVQKFYKVNWMKMLGLHFGFAESLQFLTKLQKIKNFANFQKK